MEKGYGSNWGDINICPLLHWFQLPSLSQVELSSLNDLKAWGRDRNSATTLPSCWYWPRRKLQGTGNMVFWPYGWTRVRPGSLHGGSGWETNCLGLQWTWLALHLGAVTQVHLPCTTTQGRSTWVSYLEEGQKQLPVGKSANWKSANSLSPAHKSPTP